MARHRITNDAARKGRDLRHDRAVGLHFAIYNALRVIAREERIAPTLRGIAEQLNRRGLRTNRGKEFDFRKVSAALTQLGVDRRSIRRWKEHVRIRAYQWDVSSEVLRRQLWLEWQRHIATTCEPFIPNLLHPDEWNANENKREPDWRLMHPTPQARIVHLFLGAFQSDDDE